MRDIWDKIVNSQVSGDWVNKLSYVCIEGDIEGLMEM